MSELALEIKALAKEQGAHLVGIASVDRFAEAPKGHHPTDLLPDARSVVVIAHLYAGAAQIDITPQTDIHLAGAVGESRPAQYVCDPLYAKALMLQNGEKKICFVSLDLTIITEDWTEKIRNAVAGECNIAPEAIMLSHICCPLRQPLCRLASHTRCFSARRP